MIRKVLPLPVGKASPLGSNVRFWQQYRFRTRLDLAAVVAGLSLALAGAWLGAQRGSTTVSIDQHGYRLGSLVLKRVGPGAYSGDVAVVIRQDGDVVRAAASGKVGGSRMQGLCVYVVGTESEQCIFAVGRRSFHAVDQLRDRTWRRSYDDGESTLISLAAGNPAPVPVPVDWRGR